MNNGWNEVRLGDIAEFRNGLNFKSDSHGNGCRLVGIPDFGERLIPDYNSLGEINPVGVVKNDDYLRKGDIIFVRSNGNKNLVGRSLFINRNEKLVYSGFCIRARFTAEELEPLFYAYYFKTSIFRRLISGAAGGANIQNLNQGILGRTIVPFPSLLEQRRIASFLSAYDDLIENNLRRIKLLEELAQRTYEEWFVKFRINGEALAICENTGLPEGWERKKLGDVADLISGYPFKSSTYSKVGKYKIVTIKNVQNGCFVPETTDAVNEIPPKLKDTQELKTGDILVSLTGNVGRSCLVFGENYLLNQRVLKIVARNSIDRGYLYTFIRNEKIICTLENLSNGAAQQNLSPVNMTNLEVILGDRSVQLSFANLTTPIINLICQLNILNIKLKHSRDILLPRFMNGTISVEEAENSLALAAEPEADYKS